MPCGMFGRYTGPGSAGRVLSWKAGSSGGVAMSE